MTGRHRKPTKLQDRFIDAKEDFRYHSEEVWQGALIILALVLFMAVAIYLVFLGGWSWW